MAVTGDLWHSVNLAQLCPELDPNNPGSFASLARDKVNQVEGDLQNTLTSVNNSLYKVTDLINHVNTASQSVKDAQRTLEEFVNNTANTGVYTKFLGICPVDGKAGFPPSQLIKGNNDFLNAVAKAMDTTSTGRLTEIEAAIGREQRAAKKSRTDTERLLHLENARILKNEKAAIIKNADPCQPIFSGSTAYVGGFILLVGAPNPMELYNRLKALALIFPALQGVFNDGAKKVTAISESLQDLFALFANVNDLYDQYKNSYLNFKRDNPLIDASKLVQGIPASGCPDKWICSKLKDIVPAMDPNKSGSPLNLAMSFEQELIDDLTGVMDRVGATMNTITKLVAAVGLLQNKIRDLKEGVFDFADKLAATGVYFHPIGRDLTITNNQQFVSAVGACLNDISDPEKPNFRGDTALMAGVLLVIGAPNPKGLEEQFVNVGRVFKGFSGKYKSFTTSLDDIKTNANSLYNDLTTTSSPSAAIKTGEPSSIVVVDQVPQFSSSNDEISKTTAPLEFSITNPTTSTPTADGSGTAPGTVTPVVGEIVTSASSVTPPPTDPTCDVVNPNNTSSQKVVVQASGGGEQIREARRRIVDLNKI